MRSGSQDPPHAKAFSEQVAGLGGVHTGDLCGVERTLCGGVFGDEMAHFVLGF